MRQEGERNDFYFDFIQDNEKKALNLNKLIIKLKAVAKTSLTLA